MDIIYNYILNGFNESIYVSYIFVLVFMTEFIKNIMTYNKDTKKYSFNFDTHKFIQIKIKWIVCFLGIILALLYFMMDIYSSTFDGNISKELTKLFITYAVTTTFYDLLFRLIIEKVRAILGNMAKSEG